MPGGLLGAKWLLVQVLANGLVSSTQLNVGAPDAWLLVRRFPLVPTPRSMPTSAGLVTWLLVAITAPGAVELTSIPRQAGALILLLETVRACAVSRIAMPLQ